LFGQHFYSLNLAKLSLQCIKSLRLFIPEDLVFICN